MSGAGPDPTADPTAGPTGGPILRDATAADLPAITAIYGHHVTHGLASFELAPPDLAAMTERFQAVSAQGYPYLAAELEGRLVGYAYANAYRPRPAYRFTVENTVYVAPGVQRQGIGRQLLQALIARCTEQGFRRMVAVIGDSANAPSIRLHEQQGFTHVGTIPAVGLKFGRWVDSVILQRALGVGDETLPED